MLHFGSVEVGMAVHSRVLALVAAPPPGPLLARIGNCPPVTPDAEVGLRVSESDPAFGQRSPVLRGSAG
jgi:hypothetical protein